MENSVRANVIREYEPVVSKKFRRTEYRKDYIVEHNFGSISNLMYASATIDDFFDRLVNPYLEQNNNQDIVSVAIDSSSLTAPIFVKPQRIGRFEKESFLNAIQKVSQSNRTFLLDGEFKVTVNITKSPEGRGRSTAPVSREEFRKRLSQTIIDIKGETGCFFKALYFGIQMLEKKKGSRIFGKLVRNEKNILIDGAKMLASELELPFEAPVCLAHLKDIQDQLKHKYKICVIDGNDRKNRLFYGDVVNKPTIFLEFIENNNGGHFNYIKAIKSYMRAAYYCETCHVGYQNKYRVHLCKQFCNICKSAGICSKELEKDCMDCGRSFLSDSCFRKHIESNTCKKIKRCNDCWKDIVMNEKHVCFKYKCKVCDKVYEEQPHYCWIEPVSITDLKNEDDKLKIIVSYDIEASMSKVGNNYYHSPNLLVCMVVCDRCVEWKLSVTNPSSCDICGQYNHTFFGNNCISQFCDIIYKRLARIAEAENGNVYCFAHNSRGYDGHFIFNDIWSRKFTKPPKIIMTGRKILKIDVSNVRFIDSLSFFLQPLASLPKAFGLQCISKGTFPHLFNKQENYDYVGSLPDLKYYGIENLKPAEARKVKKWHGEEKRRLEDNDLQWNFKDELIKYCRVDVEILLKSLVTFRKLFIKITGIDPITRCFTLASIGLEVFRSSFLQDKQLARTPLNNYVPLRMQSKSANAWLDWMQKCLNKVIIREYRIGRFYVDGYIPENRHVFEFLGCRTHGHNCRLSDSFEDRQKLYYNTIKRLNFFRERNYTVTEIWQCDYLRQRRTNEQMKRYTHNRFSNYALIDEYGTVNVRESFFGGRTNNLKFVHQTSLGEQIKYKDVCSLYPFVLKYKKYPIGHAKIICEDFDYTLERYFGFVKCVMIPPKNLYLPVLPMRANKKLLFPLCRTCANEFRQGDCDHNNEDRKLIGTWTTEELKYALKRGYTIDRILQVLHYDHVDDNLFKKYINMWLKVKTENSGYPGWVHNERDKDHFIEQYYLKEGISLDKEKIQRNEALRFIAKIMLNSFWGKLAQRPNLPHNDLIVSYDDYIKLVEDDKIDIQSESMVNEDVLLTSWSYVDVNDSYLGRTNIAVASYVTAWARLELLAIMEKIEKIREGSVLYHDTDSVIYIHREGDDDVPCGDYLGELTDEIGSDQKCIKFASLGPKIYAYELMRNDGTTEVKMKVKGLSLTEKTLDIITLERMIDMAVKYCNMGEDRENLQYKIPQTQFCIDKAHTVSTCEYQKIFRATSKKRRIINSKLTVPYGCIM